MPPSISGRLSAVLLTAVLPLGGCAEATDMRMGAARPPRASNCSLDIVDAMDTATFAKYEQVGVVRVGNAPAGTDPLDPSMRDLVRPRACALGGEAISVLASGDVHRRLVTTSHAGYIVWAKKRAASGPPRRF